MSISKEDEARQVQKSLTTAIDEACLLPTEASMAIFAAFGLDIMRKAASDEMFELAKRTDVSPDEYIAGLMRYLAQIAHYVKEFEQQQTAHIALAKKVKRHLVN